MQRTNIFALSIKDPPTHICTWLPQGTSSKTEEIKEDKSCDDDENFLFSFLHFPFTFMPCFEGMCFL